MSQPFRIIAHRGAASAAPENTLEAISLSHKFGCSWFEFDVGRLGDGSLVVIHDDSVDRTTNGTGAVSDVDLAYVRQLDAGSWFGPQYAGAHVPTLEEVIALANQDRRNLNLEMKVVNGEDGHRESFVAAIAQATALLSPGSELLVSSFDHDLLRRFGRQRPEVPLGYLIGAEDLLDPARPWLEEARQMGCAAINPPLENLTAELVKAMKAADLRVYVWTVNGVDDAQRLQSWGADGIFTDDVETMVKRFGR